MLSRYRCVEALQRVNKRSIDHPGFAQDCRPSKPFRDEHVFFPGFLSKSKSPIRSPSDLYRSNIAFL